MKRVYALFKSRWNVRCFRWYPAKPRTVQSNTAAMRQSMSRHKLELSPKDLDRIEFVFNAFYNGGPKMDYKFQSATPSQRVPPFNRLMLSDDHTGTNWNFLATKPAYDRVRDMQMRNR